MAEYTLRQLRKLKKQYCKGMEGAYMIATIEEQIEQFLFWVESREQPKQKGDVSRSFGSKGQEVE